MSSARYIAASVALSTATVACKRITPSAVAESAEAAPAGTASDLLDHVNADSAAPRGAPPAATTAAYCQVTDVLLFACAGRAYMHEAQHYVVLRHVTRPCDKIIGQYKH